MKKIIISILIVLFLVGCSTPTENKGEFTDANGDNYSVKKTDRVVCLYGSFASAWSLSGGNLVGVTDDAQDIEGLNLENTSVVGTVKEPNLEEIVDLDPDFVILSADIANQVALKDNLEQMKIPHAYYRVDTFENYYDMMDVFCEINNIPQNFEKYAEDVKKQIEEIKKEVENKKINPKVLLLRAYSTGVKAKGMDNLAGVMLNDMGCENIVDKYESLLEELSIEQIIIDEPEYIFITVMGSEEAAKKSVDEMINSNLAWSELNAVKNGNVIYLPQDLFHYKPNEKWGESYEYLKNILYK